MTATLPTLLDIAKLNGSDAVVGLIEEVIKAHPEVSGMANGVQIPNVGAGRTIKGTQYKTLIRTGVPAAGFRGANEGVTYGKSTWENRLVETFILNPRWQADKAVADAYEDGAAKFIALEGTGVTKGSLITLGSQFYYGVNSDSKGHPGLVNMVDASMIYDATGTTANTGSSVWMVKFGPQDVQWVWGQDGSLNLSDPRVETVADKNDATKFLTAYVQEILAYPGLQCGSKYSVVQIKNLTAETGKTLTDDILHEGLSLFPTGVKPDVIFMSRRSLKQLRKSRTATNATGAPAPIPTDADCQLKRDANLYTLAA